jgi:hypothetical protein
MHRFSFRFIAVVGAGALLAGVASFPPEVMYSRSHVRRAASRSQRRRTVGPRGSDSLALASALAR